MKLLIGIRKLFLLVAVLAQTFFPFVRRHFMSFSLLSARHDPKYLNGSVISPYVSLH